MVPTTPSAEETPGASATQNSAYRRAISLDVREVTRRLNISLGGTLVSALAGSSDTKSSHKWAKNDGPQPRPETVKRLIFAYEQWQKVTEAEGQHVARVWFIGANPWLDFDTPVHAIREGHLKDAANAARALIDDGGFQRLTPH